jgi:hypothetical protein
MCHRGLVKTVIGLEISTWDSKKWDNAFMSPWGQLEAESEKSEG